MTTMMLMLMLLIPAVLALFAHLASALLATSRSSAGSDGEGAPFRPFISLLRPVKGLDPFDRETLASSFGLDYPDFEVIFCADAQGDPACALIRAMIAAHPEVNARLLVGDAGLTSNPKLNNLEKGVAVARGDWLAMVDANLMLAPDFLCGLADSWRTDTGLVSGPPLGIRAENFWGAVECAFLNTSQARWQLAADALGMGFAQGKTLFWSRRVLDAGGGVTALGRDMAEDVASTKLVRGQGLKVHLPQRLSAQPVGARTMRAVWDRQLRWSRVRRDGFAGLFLAEFAQGPFLGLAMLLCHAAVGTVPVWLAAAFLALWYGAEGVFARALGLDLGPRDVGAMLVRDLLQPALWVATFARRGFDWRGTEMAAVATR